MKTNKLLCHNCKERFIANNKTLICLTCFKCYCEKQECWIDCNDEYFQWETDGSVRGNKGEIYISSCDECNHFYANLLKKPFLIK